MKSICIEYIFYILYYSPAFVVPKIKSLDYFGGFESSSLPKMYSTKLRSSQKWTDVKN